MASDIHTQLFHFGFIKNGLALHSIEQIHAHIRQRVKTKNGWILFEIN